MTRERTRAGLEAARAQGRVGGRRPKLKPDQAAEVRKMVLSGRKSAADAARLFGVHPATVCRLLKVDPVTTSKAPPSRSRSHDGRAALTRSKRPRRPLP
jgi:DNA invertase Pin-like site-specific DNA recombinase